jgi:hypothetical protein
MEKKKIKRTKTNFQPEKTAIRLVNCALKESGVEELDERFRTLLILIMDGALRKGHNNGIDEAINCIKGVNPDLAVELEKMKVDPLGCKHG